MNNVYNLNRELEIEKRLLHRLRRQRERISAGLSPKGYSNGQSYLDADTIHGNRSMGFTEVVEHLDRLDHYIVDQVKNVERIKEDIEEITELVNSLTGLEQKVKYMQLIQGKSLREIAITLNYNYDYIRRVATQKKSQLGHTLF